MDNNTITAPKQRNSGVSSGTSVVQYFTYKYLVRNKTILQFFFHHTPLILCLRIYFYMLKKTVF